MSRYIALCASGLEKFVVSELGEVSTVQIFDGIVLFDYKGKIEELLAVKVADDILFLVKRLAGVSRYRNSLTNIGHQIAKSNFGKFQVSSFSVKASYVGKRDYTAEDIVEVVKQEVVKKYGWDYQEGEMLIHVILREDIALCGVSLLHKKAGLKTVSGSLKSSVAYTLVKLADVKVGDVVLDPMCGAGTIPIIASAIGAKCIGGDINVDCINVAKENSEFMNTEIEFHVWNAKNTDLPDGSVDKIICNLPFGKQVELIGFFERFIDEMIRVSKKESRWILLTMQSDIISKIVVGHGMRIRDCIKIVNSGLECEILVIDT